ncbi:2,3-bisphosphoglycerate-independent phosphoglycerate mutase [Gymnodinialimonas ceratoperidinii]|uniref:2,3-bisphosphoglycerate-independent phosphoglycerate mutase n=1 Tax=Gymnodinialimonas ceratoperidinii TaxID=2856823 RepID=A0A8F6TWB0_9RHOB|nr:2,3-bisphosphoglycerate-independent phosphoglycerate mutase [Gymnodinialimonas ceratoperidinii]QXT39845.1 2,3-bisphosphoglycerate-independent phosphoglycerate mutase [Gymnodinialimonas ceratoperidinii]
MAETPRPVVLCILDGWGIGQTETDNAPLLAKTPVMDGLMARYPHATLLTHGRDVGLPEGQMGNSEVGHTNIGAGRVVKMDLVEINDSIDAGEFAQREALVAFAEVLKDSGGVAHLMGLVSDGGVHSQLAHLEAAVAVLTDAGVPVAVHAITDGRDVAPKSAERYLQGLALPDGAAIATVSGRYFALDRDNRWDRVERAYAAMVRGEGDEAPDALSVVSTAYAADKTDEFIPPTVIGDYAGMADGDGIFMLNYRADRAREILAALGDPAFDGFDVSGRPDFAAKLGMVDYSKAHDAYMTTVFPKQEIKNTLGEWVAKAGLKQFRVAETEKYPHVTFFLNGGVEVPEKGEDRQMPKSPNVATYDLQPEMSAGEVTELLVDAIRAQYDLIVVNYANPDMVGHTGDLKAAMAACEAVDTGLGKALEALDEVGGAMIICADHGNCETMIDPETGGPHTAHTTNPVPVILVGGPDGARLRDGRLADLAPSLLQLMGLEQPAEMTGESLIS